MSEQFECKITYSSDDRRSKVIIAWTTCVSSAIVGAPIRKIIYPFADETIQFRVDILKDCYDPRTGFFRLKIEAACASGGEKLSSSSIDASLWVSSLDDLLDESKVKEDGSIFSGVGTSAVPICGLSVNCSVSCDRMFRHSHYLPNGIVRVDCLITTTGRSQTLSGHLGKFYNKKSLTDVTFKVGKELLHAHKAILCARSSVFAEMFSTNNDSSSAKETSNEFSNRTVADPAVQDSEQKEQSSESYSTSKEKDVTEESNRTLDNQAVVDSEETKKISEPSSRNGKNLKDFEFNTDTESKSNVIATKTNSQAGADDNPEEPYLKKKKIELSNSKFSPISSPIAVKTSSNVCNNNLNHISSISILEFDARTFDVFLEFLYTDKLKDGSWGMARSLLPIAQRYNVQSLIEQCIEILIENLAPSNVCAIVQASNLYELETLKIPSMKYLDEHFSEIGATKGWNSIFESSSELASEVHMLVNSNTT